LALTTTAHATEEWGLQVMKHILDTRTATSRVCSPGYFNLEGVADKVPIEQQMKMLLSGLWGHGIESFMKVLENRRKAGGVQGIKVRIQDKQ
jgi:hypothetical protein